MTRPSVPLGHALIVLGMALVIAWQFLPMLPIVTAMALVGRGVILTLQARPRTMRTDSLMLINLCVYASLVCLAIVAQSKQVLQTAGTNVSLSMLLDHSLAIVLLLGLVYEVLSRLSQPTA